MSYIEQYFGKKAENLTYQNIIDFFLVEREESDKLELKSFYSPDNEKEKVNGLLRSICAFLNSSGGLLIWGAPIGTIIDGRTEKVFTGNLSPVTTLYEKDAFVGKIADSITPSPNLFAFCRIENNGNYIYLIEVTQSEYSPHQFKNTYYMRIDGQTRPAPHHYIEALFKKITYPKLKASLTTKITSNLQNRFSFQINARIFNLSKLQQEHKLFYRLQTTQGFFFPYAIPNGTRKSQEISMTVMDTLYYYQPYIIGETLEMDLAQYQSPYLHFNISLFFGGERSPLLRNFYHYRLDVGNTMLEEIERTENQYLFEITENLGLSEDEVIRRQM